MTTTTEARIVNPLIGEIPDELDREAVFEALLPLLSLLGITTHDYYSTPGITITRDEITLSIPAHCPPLRLGQHGRTLKEAETRITVRLTPEEVDGFTYQRIAADIRACR